MKTLDEIKTLSQRMVEDDKDRDAAYQAYEDIYHNLFDLPASMKALQWIRKVIDTDPHDAVRTVVRVLASRPPYIDVVPLAPDQDNKEAAQELEYTLKWCLRSANRRRRTTVEFDMAKSAVLYAEIVANVIDIDYQIKSMKARGQDTERLEQARKYGDYIINVFNPKNVHTRYSELMPECVVVCQQKPVHQVKAEYGVELDKKDDDVVEIRDYWDHTLHATWVHMGGKNTDDRVILDVTEHKLGFFPFVCLVGGDTLDDNPMHQRQGLLYPIYTSGVWETINVVKSLMVSETITHAAAPRLKEEGPNPESTTVIEYGDPGLLAKVTPGHELTQLAPPQLDTALQQISQIFTLQMGQDTVSKILQGGVPENVAFAAQNLGILTALGQVKPFMMLVERAIAEVLILKLRWAKYGGRSLEARGTGKRTDAGKQYLIPFDEIDPDSTVIEVRLDPDLPLDKMARVNAATMAKTLGMSNETALQQMGVEDPQAEMMQWYRERFYEHKFSLALQAEEAEMQLQIQQRQMEMQAQLQQQQMQQQAEMDQQAQMNEQAAMQEAFAMQGPPGMPGIEGEGFNPAAGGIPPAMMNPAATREGQMGADMSGNPLAGGF